MIHLANGWDGNAVSSFYSQVFIQGQLSLADVDVMGFSFYPFYGTGATLSNLKSSLQNIISKYGKVRPSYLKIRDARLTQPWSKGCDGC